MKYENCRIKEKFGEKTVDEEMQMIESVEK